MIGRLADWQQVGSRLAGWQVVASVMMEGVRDPSLYSASLTLSKSVRPEELPKQKQPFFFAPVWPFKVHDLQHTKNQPISVIKHVPSSACALPSFQDYGVTIKCILHCSSVHCNKALMCITIEHKCASL